MVGDARQLVKEGIVTTVYPKNHTARVTYEDKDGLTSAELPVLTMCASGDKFYSMPDVGDKVVVLFASNADQKGEGWIIGSRFHDNSKPNADSIDKTRLDFKDKTSIEYDRKKHVMKIKFNDGTIFQHDAQSKKTQLTCAGELRIKAEGNIFIDGATINLNEGSG